VKARRKKMHLFLLVAREIVLQKPEAKMKKPSLPKGGGLLVIETRVYTQAGRKPESLLGGGTKKKEPHGKTKSRCFTPLPVLEGPSSNFLGGKREEAKSAAEGVDGQKWKPKKQGDELTGDLLRQEKSSLKKGSGTLTKKCREELRKICRKVTEENVRGKGHVPSTRGTEGWKDGRKIR